MLTTGLPHGATDHLVFQNSSQKLHGKQFWIRFLGRYFLLMGIYTCVWLLFPGISLLIFLLMSFFHFGQSEFFYIQSSEKHPLKLLLYFSWGALILLSILHFNFGQSIALIGEIIPFESEIQQFWMAYGNIFLASFAVITFFCLLYFLVKRAISTFDLYIEIGLIAFFIFTFYYANLLISFVIYFGLWHAVKAIYFELRAFEQEKRVGLKKFIWAAIPFTLLSVLGIGLLMFISSWTSTIVSPLMLFFIVISVLTLPHMTFMAGLYQKKQKAIIRQ